MKKRLLSIAGGFALSFVVIFVMELYCKLSDTIIYFINPEYEGSPTFIFLGGMASMALLLYALGLLDLDKIIDKIINRKSKNVG